MNSGFLGHVSRVEEGGYLIASDLILLVVGRTPLGYSIFGLISFVAITPSCTGFFSVFYIDLNLQIE